jgi:hypothetical protein
LACDVDFLCDVDFDILWAAGCNVPEVAFGFADGLPELDVDCDANTSELEIRTTPNAAVSAFISALLFCINAGWMPSPFRLSRLMSGIRTLQTARTPGHPLVGPRDPRRAKRETSNGDRALRRRIVPISRSTLITGHVSVLIVDDL